mgnify:CR=1 FL=1
MEAVATPLAGKPLFSNKALKKLIFPLVIEQFLAISVGFCDTVMTVSYTHLRAHET